MIKNPIVTTSPNGSVLVKTFQPSTPYGSLSIRELEAQGASHNDDSALIHREEMEEIANQLSKTGAPQHEAVKCNQFLNAMVPISKRHSHFHLAALIAETVAATVAMQEALAFNHELIYYMLPLSAFILGHASYFVATINFKGHPSYEDLLFTGGNTKGLSWKKLVRQLLHIDTSKHTRSRVRRLLRNAGVSEKQLLNNTQPIKENGAPLNGKDVHEIFATRTGTYHADALSDFVRTLWSIRAAGKLDLHSDNFIGPAQWFNNFAEAMTGESPRDVAPSKTSSAEYTTPFLTLVRDCSYYNNNLPLSIAASSAYLMRYYIEAGQHEDNAWKMLESVRSYLGGDLGSALMNHIDALAALPGDDEASLEIIGVRSLHQQILADLITAGAQTTNGSSEKLKMIAAEFRAKSAAGLRELIQEGNYVEDIVGLGSLLARTHVTPDQTGCG